MSEASRRREYIRTHHPDRGGDPETFITGLRSLTSNPGQPGPLPRVTAVHRRSWPARLASAATRRARREQRVPRVR